MTAPVDLNIIVNWPQAVVASVIVLAVVIGLPVVNIIQNVAIKRRAEIAAHEVRPNSGKSLADNVNQIKTMLTEHIEQSNARFEELEQAKGRHKN